MKLHQALMAMTLLGCSKGPSTAAGPIGEVDLASRLPAGVTVPANATAHGAALSICPGGKGDPPVGIHARWKTFAKDKTSYLASYAVSLDKQVSGLTVVLDGEAELSTVDTPAPSVIAATSLKCTRVESRKLVFAEPAIIYLRGDGISGVKK